MSGAVDSAQLPPFLCIFGPTGCGKTETLHRLFAGRAELISADSMQVYKHLHIGTARPGADIVRELPHHLIDILELDQVFDAGSFVRRAEELLLDIASRGMVPIVSGGTGFYIRALLYGLPDLPASDWEQRRRLEQRLLREGAEGMRKELEQLDPVSAARIEPADHYRLLRALEVYHTTGRTRSSYKVTETLRHGLRVLPVHLHRSRAELYERINARVESMIRHGLCTEVAELLNAGYSTQYPGLRSIGYREFFQAVEQGTLTSRMLAAPDAKQNSDVQELIRLIQRNTRRYAKRQMLFFRGIREALGIHADDDDGLRSTVKAFFQRHPPDSSDSTEALSGGP